jgi:mannose-1-phosphate guanylyltransferase
MDSHTVGNVVMSDRSNNSHVINELDILVTVLGVRDMVIVASPDGILISDKYEISFRKEYVGGLSKRPMYEESS